MESILALADGSVSDEVKPVKMAWWEDELRRFGAGSARHPDTQQLAASGVGVSSYPLLHQWLVASRTKRTEEEDNHISYRIDAFRRFGVLLLLTVDEPQSEDLSRATTALACALTAVTALDRQTPESGDETGVNAIRTDLERAKTHANPGLRALAATTDYAITRKIQRRRIRPLRLMWHAWRGARTTPGKIDP